MKKLSLVAILLVMFIVVASPTPTQASCLCYSDNNLLCPTFNNPECKNATTDPSSPSYIPPASSTYTCSGGTASGSSISVTDPGGAGANQVGTFNSQCTAGGGTPSGASSAQLQAAANPAATPATPTTATAGPCSSCNLSYTPLEPIPGLVNSTVLTNPGSLPAIISAIFKIFITVAALFAVLMLTVGGLQYMISGGPAEKNKGIQRAKAAMWGVLLIAASWLILNTINPKLLQFSLNPCPSGVNCTVSASPNTTTGNPSTGAGAGACGSEVNGCNANQYCGTSYSGPSGTVAQCLDNTTGGQAANQACTAGGGTYTAGLTGYYCWLSQYTTQAQCQAGGGSWGFLWFC